MRYALNAMLPFFVIIAFWVAVVIAFWVAAFVQACIGRSVDTCCAGVNAPPFGGRAGDPRDAGTWR
jgi:hypothetical protein